MRKTASAGNGLTQFSHLPTALRFFVPRIPVKETEREY